MFRVEIDEEARTPGTRALPPERDEFVLADPAGLAVFEGELSPTEKGFADEGDAACGEGGRFLRSVGFGRD